MKVIDLIPKEYRRRGLWVMTTLLLRALMNMASLAVMLPVLVLVLDPESLTGDNPMARIYAASGISSPHRFAIATGCAVVAFILLKSLLTLLLARAERHYIYDLYASLSRRLYSAYHDLGLAFVKRHNSAVLTRNVNVVCLQFTAGVLRASASLIVEMMFFAMLFTALALYSPLAALLAAAVFLPTTWGYYAMIRNRMNRYGDIENRAQREKARIVADTFRGFADIEISAAFPQMLHSFERAMQEVVRTRMKEASIGVLPTLVPEIALSIGMALLVLFGAGDRDMQILFGLFAVAALRLMPSVRAILGAWTSLRYNRYTIDILGEALAAAPATDSAASSGEKMTFEREIAVRNIRFRFDDGDRDIFTDYSLTIRKGERLGIRGTSGSGKTTLFNLLLGLYTPTAGSIEIDGTPITPANRRTWQNRVGYVSQNLFLVDGTFAENVALGTPVGQIDRKRVGEVLATAQMGDFIASLPDGIDTRLGECGCRLSGGQRQRIGIARALYRRSDVLFFDEATSSLDSATEEEINRSIAALAEHDSTMTIVVIAHRESTLEYCNRIITIEKQ